MRGAFGHQPTLVCAFCATTGQGDVAMPVRIARAGAGE
jgi:hypothetical protein